MTPSPAPWRSEGSYILSGDEIVAERVAPQNVGLVREAPRLAEALRSILKCRADCTCTARAVLRAAGVL